MKRVTSQKKAVVWEHVVHRSTVRAEHSWGNMQVIIKTSPAQYSVSEGREEHNTFGHKILTIKMFQLFGKFAYVEHFIHWCQLFYVNYLGPLLRFQMATPWSSVKRT